MRYLKLLFICLLSVFIINSTGFSQIIKLGSLVPTGSPWDLSLKQLAAEWNRISGGKVILKIYPGGIAGDEGDMVRKIRFGQLDASAMTSIGLNHIFTGVLAIQLPTLVRDDKEMDFILKKLGPYLEEKIEEKGFKLLIWSKAGWTYFFSKRPVVSPDDLKSQKIFVWEGDADLVQTWKEFGFHPVPLAATEIMTSLQSGMIDTLATSPLTAASYQWFGIANNMCGLKWSPFIGGIVISKKTWDKFSPEWQSKFMESARNIGEKMDQHVFEADKKAMTVMKKNGLKVHPVSSEVEKQWHAIIEKGLQRLIGKSIHKETYEKVKKYLEEYRSK